MPQVQFTGYIGWRDGNNKGLLVRVKILADFGSLTGLKYPFFSHHSYKFLFGCLQNRMPWVMFVRSLDNSSTNQVRLRKI